MTDHTPGHRCYSLVRPNPFLGTVQVVEVEGARAISPDGLKWEIQVLAERPANLWGTLSQGGRVTDFYTFGTWSRGEGLTRVPVNPLFDIGSMLEESERVVGLLESETAATPFDPLPAFELWLLDQAERAPLALLAIASHADARRAVRSRHWTAARRGDQGFRAPSQEARGIPARPRRHLSAVEKLVTRAAGSLRLAQWFRREPGGSATGLAEGVPAELARRRLAAESFPELLLCGEWPDPEDAALFRDYRDWLAPRLLTLPGLTAATRARLERKARAQAGLVDRLWRVYPEVIDRSLIEEARVEARLRQANPSVDERS